MRAASTLGWELYAPFDRGRGGPGGWTILYKPELHLHGDLLVPELAGWRRERMPALPESSGFEVAPDWVCEVLSPATAAIERAEKPPITLARECNVWLIDPALQTLKVFRRDGASNRVLRVCRGDAIARWEPFEVAALGLAKWWSA